MCWESILTEALPGRSTCTVLLRWHLGSLAFCLTLIWTPLSPGCWRFTGASSGPICNVVCVICKFICNVGTAKCHLELLNKIQKKRQDILVTPTSLSILLLSMLVAEWPPYLCFTDNITVTVLIVLLSSCNGRTTPEESWRLIGTLKQCTFIGHAPIPL